MADNNGLFIRLYIDEDVHESLLPALRQHGYEANNVREANRRSLSDAEQLAYAAVEGYTIFTFKRFAISCFGCQQLVKNF